MNKEQNKVYYGTQAKYKFLGPTNTRGARYALYIDWQKVKEYPYDSSMGGIEQFVEKLRKHFFNWQTCIITVDKGEYVANVTMGTEL